MSQLNMKTPNLTDENIKKLGELFPSCLTETLDAEGKPQLAIDFDLLKQELSHSIVEGNVERYQLDWPGKRESLLTANVPIAKTLRPNRSESVNFDETENLFIEGDNLEALKLLQESYLGKVKMIYIDPPYNTGNDFVYNDDFAEDSEEYFERSLQKDEEGNRLVANPESKGRYHSDWLSMMHSRLRLARNLLTDDGVIFISIDDNEQANLKRLCDEVFGEQNFISTACIVRSKNGLGSKKGFAINHDYFLVYQKSSHLETFLYLKHDKEYIDKFNKQDKHGKFKIDGLLRKKGAGQRREESPGCFYPIYYDGNKISLEHFEGAQLAYPKLPDGTDGRWIWSKDFAKERLYRIYISNGGTVYVKDYLHEASRIKPKTILDKNSYLTENATEELKNLFEQTKVFDTPKPVELIKDIVDHGVNHNGIILDFFAGSATTAHAVMQLNAEDGGNRKFIMVQLPEAVDEKSEAYKAGYKNIAEISKERIRRAGKQILEPDNIHENWNKDIGFRVLKIDESNMKDVFYKPHELNQSQLFDQVDNVKEDRNAEDLLFQIMLDWGLELSLPVHIETIQGKQVYCVAEDALIACFDQDITEELVKELANKQPMRLLFRDNYYANNDVKINAGQLVKQLSPKTELKSI